MTANKGIFNLNDTQGERNEGGLWLGTSPGHLTWSRGDAVGRFGRPRFVAEVIPKELYQTINRLLHQAWSSKPNFLLSWLLKVCKQQGVGCFHICFPLPDSQVIYRSLPKWESLDPFGDEAQQQLKVTNIRIRLLSHQPCPCQAKDLTATREPLPTQHFAIYDLIVKGSCSCNGHAEQCVPALGYQPTRDRTSHVVRTERNFNKCKKKKKAWLLQLTDKSKILCQTDRAEKSWH